jgi:hypothetical protein
VRVEKLKQFSIFMPNKPGALSRLAALFKEKGISIVGIASEVRDDSGLVRIALAHDADVSSLLSKAGFSSVETHVLSVEVGDRAGQLLRVTEALAEGKINITTVYGTAVSGAQTARILIAVQNTDKAFEILQHMAAADPSPA